MNRAPTFADAWITDDGPAAVVIREHLMPVEGTDGVVFPATFASGDNFAGGYNIDEFGDGRNVCLVDTVGSQANRLEPLFTEKAYAGLVPQIVVKAGRRRINLLEAGHRAGDAIVRCSALRQELQGAFKAAQSGDAVPLARIAPTSLVFGVWDSRDTQAKQPRLVASTVRAYDVRRLSRSAQFVPAVDYIGEGLLEDVDDKKVRDAYSERGFVHVPASASHGGVIATAGIRRDAALHLAALRLLRAGADEEQTLALRQYILGLALTALTHSPSGYLRQGCNLVADPDRSREFKIVYSDGRREDCVVSHADALEFARTAAAGFGVDPRRKPGEPPDREVDFDPELAKKDVAGDTETAARKKKAPRGK